MLFLEKTLFVLTESKYIQRGLILLAIASIVVQLIFWLPRTLNRTDPWRDLIAYYLVKERIHNGAPLYTQPAELGPNFERGPHIPYQILYLYPPFLASALSFLPKMSFTTFARFWTLLLYGSFWIYSMVLAKLASGKISFSGTLIASLFLFVFPGTFRALELGQVDPLLWMFFGLALLIYLCRGFFTMTIALIKPWAVWPLLWSFEKNCRQWLGIVSVLTASTLVGILALGGAEFIEACKIWFTQVLPSLAQGTWSSDNRSLSFGFLRLVHHSGLWTYHGGELPLWAKNWLLTCSITGPCLTGWYLRHNTKNLQLASVACAAILFSPICWTSYLPILLTPAAILFHEKFYKNRGPQ